MTVLVQLAGGGTRRFADDVHPSSRPGGNRTYYEWVQHTYRVRRDRTLCVVERRQESWYHFSGEHRDVRMLAERVVASFPPTEWVHVE